MSPRGLGLPASGARNEGSGSVGAIGSGTASSSWARSVLGNGSQVPALPYLASRRFCSAGEGSRRYIGAPFEIA